MKTGMFTIIRCISAKYSHLLGNSSPYLVSGKAIQLEDLILLQLIEMKKKRTMFQMIQMIDGSIIHNLEYLYPKELK